MNNFTYISTFSGIGGFEKGIEQAYEANLLIRNGKAAPSVAEAVQQGMEPAAAGHEHTGDRPDHISAGEPGAVLDYGRPTCLGYSEIDKYAASIYQKHFPTHHNYGDITKLDADSLPDFDFLCGGFPCQAFSIAGKRGGFSDTRGTLFFDLARILKAKQPRLFLFENVKGLLSHDNGKTFATIIATLDELGYDLQWQVLNSKNHGVPQNRERIFIVGHLRGTARPEVFPFTGNDGVGIEEGGNANVSANTLTANYWKGPAASRPIVATQDGNAHTIDANYYKGLLANQARTGVLKEARIRRLTPTECERLQGFPDNWTAGISDTQRYKCCGNAVTVNVIEAIMARIFESL